VARSGGKNGVAKEEQLRRFGGSLRREDCGGVNLANDTMMFAIYVQVPCMIVTEAKGSGSVAAEQQQDAEGQQEASTLPRRSFHEALYWHRSMHGNMIHASHLESSHDTKALHCLGLDVFRVRSLLGIRRAA